MEQGPFGHAQASCRARIQGRGRMAHLCSTMSSSEASAGKTWMAVRSWGKDGNQWGILDFGHSFWVDAGAASWNWEDLQIGDTVGISDSQWGRKNLEKNFLIYFLLIYLSERQREWAQAGGVASRGWSSLPAEQGAQCRTRSQDPGIMTWAEGRHLAYWATQASLEE